MINDSFIVPPKNYLLASLPAADILRILPKLKSVSFKFGEVLYESGDKMDYVYFPTTAIISMLYIMENGLTAEVGVIGNEGVVGIALLMGNDQTISRAIVQYAGEMFRMGAQELRAEFALGGRFQELLLRYTQALMTQISQTAVCNRLHSVEQQLCRWLLIICDRAESDQLVMTQKLIAKMLGVRREAVTHAARKLQEKGLIKYVRGTITILDRKGLEGASCECYKVVNNEYKRLLGIETRV